MIFYNRTPSSLPLYQISSVFLPVLVSIMMAYCQEFCMSACIVLYYKRGNDCLKWRKKHKTPCYCSAIIKGGCHRVAC